MADSTPNIQVDKGAWRDLYTLSGIAVGTQIIVQNVGNAEIRLFAGAAPPATANEGIPLPVYTAAQNDIGDSGAWVYSIQDGRVNVRAA
jgi:hypothetical protein